MAGKLSIKRVAALKKTGRFGDGNGLYLSVSKWKTKAWVYRYQLRGRSHEMGLGPYPLISLAEARERVNQWRKLRLDGIDPVEARRGQRTQERLEAAKSITFRQCADSYIKAHEPGWTNAKHRYQWRQTMDLACETLGDLPVASVDTSLVVKTLEPIWPKKPETAKRLRGRIEAVLDWATAREFRTGPNPARWRGHLDKLLTKTSSAGAAPSRAALRRPAAVHGGASRQSIDQRTGIGVHDPDRRTDCRNHRGQAGRVRFGTRRGRSRPSG